MTTSDDNPVQAPDPFSDEDRPLMVTASLESGNPAEQREAFADLLVRLRGRLREQGEMLPHVSREVDRLLEETFKGSDTYRLAFELYTRRFSLVGLRDPAEVIRRLLDEQLSPPPHDNPEDQATATART